jgi:membrane protein DedA with SNARE-associated domain
MQVIAQHLVRHGAGLVFANVFVQQIGVPVPTGPTLLLSGSLAAQGLLSPVRIVAATVVAAALADAIWFLLGRRFGPAVGRRLRRRSPARAPAPVRPGHGRLERWGVRALLVARFVPGAAHLIVPMAGARHVPFALFFLYDLAGIALWASLAVIGGMLFHGPLEGLLRALPGGGG